MIVRSKMVKSAKNGKTAVEKVRLKYLSNEVIVITSSISSGDGIKAFLTKIRMPCMFEAVKGKRPSGESDSLSELRRDHDACDTALHCIPNMLLPSIDKSWVLLSYLLQINCGSPFINTEYSKSATSRMYSCK